MKRFIHYEQRAASLREVFIRKVLRRTVPSRRPSFWLRDFSLDVAPGEAVGLVGDNGSGKSTVLRLIAGVYTPTSGTIETRGRLAAVIELGVGFHPDLTGAENVEQYAAVMGLSRAELRERFDQIVEFSGIGEYVHEPVKYYSSGMHVRLAFSVAVAVQPSIFLVDETTAVGDQDFREQCITFIRQYVAGGGTLVAVSHDLPILRALCHRAVWLDGGETRMVGPVNEVLDAYEHARGPTAE